MAIGRQSAPWVVLTLQLPKRFVALRRILPAPLGRLPIPAGVSSLCRRIELLSSTYLSQGAARPNHSVPSGRAAPPLEVTGSPSGRITMGNPIVLLSPASWRSGGADSSTALASCSGPESPWIALFPFVRGQPKPSLRSGTQVALCSSSPMAHGTGADVIGKLRGLRSPLPPRCLT